MPARIEKIDGKYKVVSDGVHAKSTTLKKAKRQQRLLNAIYYSGGKWKPTGKKAIS